MRIHRLFKTFFYTLNNWLANTSALPPIFFLAILMTPYYGFSGPLPTKHLDLASEQTTYAFDFGGSGIYLQPKLSFYLGDGAIDTLYKWGYILQAEYGTDPNRQIDIMWQDYTNKVDGLTLSVNDLHNEGPAVATYDYRHKFDIVYLQLRQNLSLKDKVLFRFHGGLEYLYLNTMTLSHITSNQSRTENNTFYQLKLNSGGPVLGIDFYYKLSSKIDLYINDNFALLIDKAINKTWETSINRTGPQVTTTVNANIVKMGSAVSSSFAELGLNYQKKLSDSILSIQGGWIGVLIEVPTARYTGAFLGAKWHGFT